MNPKVTMVIRILLGAFVLFFGINKFAGFFTPEMPDGQMKDLMMILSSSAFMAIIGIIEVASGIALLINKYVPLALILITAVMLNALLFHLFYEPSSAGGAAIGLILSIVLVYANKERFSGVLSQ